MLAYPSGEFLGQAVAGLKKHHLSRRIGQGVPKDFIWPAV
jgi:hypothetical protein